MAYSTITRYGDQAKLEGEGEVLDDKKRFAFRMNTLLLGWPFNI